MPSADHAPILGAMTTITNSSRSLCLLLVALMLSSGCGDSTSSHTLPKVRSCLTDHGATVLSTGFTSHGEDVETNAIDNLITGYKGTVSGMFHQDAFNVDVYDDVYLTPYQGSKQDFEPLDPCFDQFGPYTFSP
jgi:hypothetical protein